MMISLALNDVYVTLHSENSNEVLSPESIFFTSMLTTQFLPRDALADLTVQTYVSQSA